MKRKFLLDLTLLIGLNLLIKPFYILVIEAGVQNAVGPEVYGSYFALINFSFILNIFLDFGTTNWNTRRIATDPESALQSTGTLMRLRLWLALMFFVVSLSAGLMLGYDQKMMYGLLLLSVNQCLASFILFLRSWLTGLHLFKADSVISILDRLILIGVVGSLLITHKNDFQINWFIWAQTAAYALTALAAAFWVFRQGKARLPVFTGYKSVLQQSLPFAILIFISAIAYRVDSVMIERMHPFGAREAGIYAMGFRFFEAFNMIAYLFAVILLPTYARLIAQRESVQPVMTSALRILSGGAGSFLIPAIFFSGTILNMIYEGHEATAESSFRWLMAGCYLFSLQYVFGSLLTANGNLKVLTIIASAGMLINVATNLFLIPQYGAEGAAIANVLTNGVILIAQIIAAFVIFRIRTELKLVIRMTLFTGLSIVLSWALAVFSGLDAIIDLHPAIGFMFSALLCLGAALSTRVLDLSQAINLLKMRNRQV